MAKEICSGFGNTGYYENCESNFKVMRGIIFTPTFDGSGVLNKVAAGTEIDEDYLSDQINEADPLKRWYPVMGIEAVAAERADPILFTNPSGAIEFVKDGVKTVNFEVRRLGSEYLGVLKACGCSKTSFFSIDADNKIRGKITAVNVASDFYPVKMQPGSFYSKLIDATEENPEHILVSFQYGITEKDENLRVYPTSLTTADFLGSIGLIDVYSAYTVVTTTGFVADLTTRFTDGDEFKPEGLLVGDFALTADGTPVVITSVAENTPGKYTFVIPTTLTTKVKVLTPTKDGYDFKNVVANSFTVGA